MRRHSRTSHVVRWVVLTLCLVLFLVVAISSIWDLSWGSQSGNSAAGLSGGYAWFGERTGTTPGVSSSHWGGPGWSFDHDLTGFRFHFDFHPKAWVTFGILPQTGVAFGVSYVAVPLLIPLIVLAIPTLYILYRYRRYPLGHCQSCGYNLTGNLSGVCPECGATVKQAGDKT